VYIALQHQYTPLNSKCAVKVPTGCLLVQAGKQLEYLTAGHIQSGFHEVAVNEHTVAAIEQAQQSGKSLWRVSSTCFAHCASDQVSKKKLHCAQYYSTAQSVAVLLLAMCSGDNSKILNVSTGSA
jgi:hypothetical protein